MYMSRCVFERVLRANIVQIEEVKGVVQVLDQEEEIALQEFTKFEEKLKLQRRSATSTTTMGIAN